MREFGGTARHLRQFLPALGEHAQGHEFFLYVNSDFPVLDVPENVEIVPVDIRFNLGRVWWDQIQLPEAAREERADAIWCLLGFGSLHPPVPQLLFQRNPVYYCDHHLELISASARAALSLRRSLQMFAMKASARVITPTDAMRDMIRAKHPHLPSELFYTLPHALDPDILAPRQSLPPSAEQAIASLGDDTFLFLYSGHILPYKRLDILLTRLRLRPTRHVE
jgi:glycosyltransferase involved in cell wall biosynthesis